jgi:N-glycosylase/DNA lyase
MDKEKLVNTILEINIPLNQRVNNEPLKILSEEDWKFWKQNGYVIIHDAIPKEHIDRLVDLIWEFEEKNPNDPNTWYAAFQNYIEILMNG